MFQVNYLKLLCYEKKMIKITKFVKTKTEHHIMVEFHNFIQQVEKISEIKRIVPWRIDRQQKWSSDIIISFSYFTISWAKYKIKKWSTAQELFVLFDEKDRQLVYDNIQQLINKYVL